MGSDSFRSFCKKLGAWDHNFGWIYRTALLVIFLLTLAALPIWVIKSSRGNLAPKLARVPPAVRDASTVDSASPAADLSATNLYPYSVIPGGAHDRDELQRAMANDPIVAAHYGNFDAGNTSVVRLDHAEFAYVSYRMGSAIFWTRRPLTIPAGETLLTDGKSLARTRCGNRLSLIPESPVSQLEPPEAVMEATPDLRRYAVNLPSSSPVVSRVIPADPAPALTFDPGTMVPAIPAPLGGPGGTISNQLPPPFFPIYGVGGPANATPPVSTPEPGSITLLGLGAILLALASRIVARRRTGNSSVSSAN